MDKYIIKQDIENILKSNIRNIFKLRKKTLLISGGAGFIGNYIIRTIQYFNQKYKNFNCRLISIDNYLTSSKQLYNKKDKYLYCINHDVSKPLHIRKKIDYIIHAAGIASPVYYQKYPLQAIEVNTQGTKNLLDIGQKNKVKSFLYFSSSEIYGDPDSKHIPTPETYRGNVSCTGPRSCYDESKRLGESLVVNYYDVYKLPVKTVRPFNIYGPGMKFKDYRVIPSFLYNAISGKPLTVHDTGKQTRTYCYISDAISAIFSVLLNGRPRESYNIGNDKPEITTYALAKLISKLVGKKTRIKLIPYPNNYPQDVPQRRCPNLTKIKTELGYQPRINLPTGLKRMITWYLNS